MKVNLNLLMLLSIVVLMSSCVSKKKWTQLLSDKASVDSMLETQKNKVKELEGKITSLEGAQADLQSKYNSEAERAERLAGEVSQFKMDLESSQSTAADAMSKLKLNEGQLAELQNKVRAAVSGGGFSLSPRNGRLYVNAGETILFNSGSVRVKRSYNPTLESVANVLKGNPSLRLIIEGHADNTPVKAGVAYADNWDVSLARSKAVVKKLIRMGVPESQLLPTGRGEHVPVAADDSAEARKMNRRVDFIVMPNLSSLMSASRP